jgi:THO complex subunit 2
MRRLFTLLASVTLTLGLATPAGASTVQGTDSDSTPSHWRGDDASCSRDFHSRWESEAGWDNSWEGYSRDGDHRRDDRDRDKHSREGDRDRRDRDRSDREGDRCRCDDRSHGDDHGCFCRSSSDDHGDRDRSSRDDHRDHRCSSSDRDRDHG